MARQKSLSILHHTAGQHSFPSFSLFPKCEHGPLDETKGWIPEGKHEFIEHNSAKLYIK